MDSWDDFKRGPWFSILLGMLACLELERSQGVLHFKGRHYAGNCDFYFLLVFFGIAGVALTAFGIYGLVKPSTDDDD